MTVGHPRRPSRRWRGLQRTGKTLANGQQELGKPIIVNCHNHDAVGLCSDCLADFRLVLADVPWLLDDLDVAIAGLAEFVQRGQDGEHKTPPAWAQMGERFLDTISEEESVQLARSPRRSATTAHHRLAEALETAADWFDQRHPEQLAVLLLRMLDQLVDEPALRKVAREVSQAAARAHKVIDAPPQLWYYGPCPDCRAEIWQDRIHKDDDETKVECKGCDYAETVPEHQRRLLDAANDRWLTVTELVAAIETSREEVVTRNQIEGWIYRGGLAREKRVRPTYVDGELVLDEVWTYRLGDVRERAEQRRGQKVSG